MSASAAIIARTPAPDCPACTTQRRHTEEDWQDHHPYARHGFSSGQGWSHPDLDSKTSEAK